LIVRARRRRPLMADEAPKLVLDWDFALHK